MNTTCRKVGCRGQSQFLCYGPAGLQEAELAPCLTDCPTSVAGPSCCRSFVPFCPSSRFHCPAAGAKPSPPTAAEFFLISAVAKLGATVLTYPLLVVKSRLQAANKDTHVDLKYTGAVDAVTRIWKHEGEQLP